MVLSLAEDVGSHWVESSVEDAFFHLQFLLSYGVAVFAVFNGNGDGYCGWLLIEVDNHGSFLAALHNDLLAIVADDDVFGLSGIGVTELVDGAHHGVLELVVAHFAYLVVTPVILAGASVGA